MQPAEEREQKFLSSKCRRGLEKEHSSWEKLPLAGLHCVKMQREMGADLL